MARVRGTLNRYKESDYIFVTVERFGEKIKKKESEEKLYSHNHFESSQIIFVFVFFFLSRHQFAFF